MAKRKTKATKPTAPRRTSRRGNRAATEGETSAPTDPSNSESTNQKPPSEPPPPADDAPDPQASTSTASEFQKSDTPSTKPCQVPVVATHKKFGKYRCLFNSDDPFTKKYEIGSDSETSNSMDIKADVCGGSESDSNAALDTQSDTNSGACYSPSALIALQGGSRDISPVAITRESGPGIPFLTDSDHSESILSLSNHMDDCNEDQKIETPEPGASELLEINTDCIPLPEEQQHEDEDIPLEEEEHIMYGDAGDDDEIITVVQIVEDDHPELYYNIKIDSPKESNETEDQDPVEMQKNEIQKHFASLNLDSTSESRCPMDFIEVIDITTPPCTTPDLSYQKEDAITRPDPSITPSSTLSDDSNSSRVTEQTQNDSAESSPSGVRRSSRIKTISNLKQKTKGYGLVKTPLKKALITQTKLKLEELGSDSQEKSLDLPAPNSPSFPVPSEMPVKVKSRWRRSSELEMVANSPTCSPLASPNLPQPLPLVAEAVEENVVIPLSKEAYDRIIRERIEQFQHLEENEYLCDRMISKDTKKMICDCFMTKEELERGELACGEDCLNRLLMIECNSRCPVGDRCTNRRFQKRENGPLKVFYADKKGCGIEAASDITMGEFLMEYIGEVLDYEQFYKRAQAYSDDNNLHHYFMSLKGETVIDATLKGNISRFINHSCEPNAETQKWTVNGELRIGFFSKRDIVAGEEITFDYQFQRFGKVAQRCYCGAENCRGWIGAEPDSDDEDYEEEEEDVTTSKSGASDASEETATAAEVVRPRPRLERKYKPKAPDLVQDADIEEDLEALSRTGVKNQCHTLRLSRTVVRAKSRRAQVALLRLLRDADLPCRRLFLDYRGLRLLAPWCSDAPLDFKLEMLQTIDRLPIPNKSMVHESRFFTIFERWMSSTETPAEQVFIDEATGLPMDILNRGTQDNTSPEKPRDNAATLEKVKDLSSQLLERWSSLKEVFKIPKKERIQQMKEHERQANVERRAADSSGSRDRDRDRREDRDRDREKDRDRERERDKERERERERDRDRYRERERDRNREKEREERERRRRKSPDGRRSIRLSERVLAAVPPMSKEERRRAFAEAAAAADESRRQRDVNPIGYPYWPQPDHFPQMFPPGMMGANNMPMMMPGGNMMPGNNMIPGNNMMPGNINMSGNMPPGNMIPPGSMMPPGNMMPPGSMMPPGGMMPGMMPGMPSGDMPPEWLQNAQSFCPPFQPGQPYCMQQPNMMGNMGMGGFGMGGFMFGQQMPPGAFPPLQQHTETQLAPTIDPETKQVVLPSMWRSAEDPRGRTYYYHVKIRRPQWLPPPLPPSPEESSSEEEEEQVSTFDSPVVRRQMKGSRFVEGLKGICEVSNKDTNNGLIPDHALLSMKPRKRRPGLVSERPISPRTEEDKLAGRLEVKRYRQTKEKLRRRKEKQSQKVRVLASSRKMRVDPTVKLMDVIDSGSDSEETPEAEDMIEKAPTVTIPSPIVVPSPEVVETVVPPVVDTADATRKIKEQFRSNMARVMVGLLSPYKRTDAPIGKITCTADFKHLARKLTHFVMLKELKHCRSVDELVVTDSVKSKAKTFTKKYMTKFGPVYSRPADELD